VLDGAEKRYAARRSFGLRLVLAFAGVFVVGTAFARYGAVMPAIEHVLEAARNAFAPAPAAKPAPVRKRASKPPAASAPIEPAKPEPATPAEAPAIAAVATEVATPTPAAARARVPRRPARTQTSAPRVPPAAATTTVTEAAPAPESAELALFRRAQALHVARDPQALAAWDAYLRVAGQGVLAPEARYNRALCLIRAGRNAEARAALLPFANGELGAYRRDEARALLAELPQ
jgi:hypothetical protein